MTDAIVVGSTGQDGALLCERLLREGFSVAGSYRSSSSSAFWRIDQLGIQDDIDFFDYEIGRPAGLADEIRVRKPSLVFFAAGDSMTAASQDAGPRIMSSNVVGCAEQIQSLRQSGSDAKAAFFGSSEVFGYSSLPGERAAESTPMRPVNPYGLSKQFAGSLVDHYRNSESMSLFEAILFPHESEFRGSGFLVRKVVSCLVRAKVGVVRGRPTRFGALDSTRDWGSARDYMDLLVELMKTDAPPDRYVFGTGVSHSVRDVFEIVASVVDLALEERDTREGRALVDASTGHLVAIVEARSLANAGHGLVGSSKKLFDAIGEKSLQPLRQTLSHMVEVEFSQQRLA